MDYEEKYKDLVKRLNKAREEKGVYTFNSVLDVVAPELKIDESEDEKIRKAAIEFVRQNKSFHYSLGISKEQVLAWIEKQGEQKPVWSKEDEKIANNFISELGNLCTRKLIKEETAYKYINWLKSLKDRVQPKIEWSYEDRIHLDNCIALIQILSEREANWLRTLRPQSHWKPSDEQIRELGIVATGKGWFSKEILSELLEQLKKLREE